jgi:hypothetical protein
LDAQTATRDVLPHAGGWCTLRRRLAVQWPAVTLDHVWLSATLVFAFLVGTLVPLQGPDYWWTVKLGEGLWTARQLPTQDWLSFSATGPSAAEQQWLAQLVLAAVHHLGGLELALVLRGLIQMLVAGGLFLASRRLGAGPVAAAVACAVALPLLVGGAAVRPQLLTLPLFTLFLLGTTIWRGRAWTLVALPLAMIAWTNLHGTFLLGIGLVGIALLGRGWEVRAAGWRGDTMLRRLALLLVLCAVAPLANPYGAGLVPWIAHYMTYNTGGQGLPVLSTDWQPTSFAAMHGRLFFLTVFALVVVLVRVGPPSPAESLRLLVFAALALQAVRSTTWWALVMAPVLAWGLSRWPRPGMAPAPAALPRRAGVPAINLSIIAGLLMVAAFSLPWLRPLGLLRTSGQFPLLEPTVPVRAADYVATLPATRLFGHVDWGGYLAWRLAPRQRIFLDMRLQDYPVQTVRDYFTIARGEVAWKALLAAYEVDGLVLSRRDEAPLLAAIEADGSWQAVYCDATSAVYLPRATVGERTVPCGPADTSTAGGPS